MSEPLSTDPLSRYIPPDTAAQARVDQRNWFYESLSPEAKDRFLEALKAAQTRGLGEEAAWEEAVVAAETTYPSEGAVEERMVDERVVDGRDPAAADRLD